MAGSFGSRVRDCEPGDRGRMARPGCEPLTREPAIDRRSRARSSVMRSGTLIRVFALAVWVGMPITADGQEPTTRAETLQREREEKAKQLTPPEQSRVERTLMDLESGRLFERILNPAEGLYPKMG